MEPIPARGDEDHEGYEFDYLHDNVTGEETDDEKLDCSRGSLGGYHSA